MVPIVNSDLLPVGLLGWQRDFWRKSAFPRDAKEEVSGLLSGNVRRLRWY